MYVCLCKGLRESDVSLAARACIEQGAFQLEDVIEVLNLNCEEACGYCVENPDVIESIVSDEVESATIRSAVINTAI